MDFTQYKSNTFNKGACYVLSDGSFLNMCEMIDLLKGKKANHRTLDFYLERKEKTFGHRVLKMQLNAVAINDGTNFDWEHAYIDPPLKPLTQEQYDSILKWLDYCMTVSPLIDVDDTRKRVQTFYFVSKDNPDGVLPEDIIKMLKRIS